MKNNATEHGQLCNGCCDTKNAYNMITLNNPYNEQYGYAQYIRVRA